ncbi:hypothetical protein D082_09920 [Synechocystis sp. PCC 6714]|nr:hypothetical protein D082_09920 [Synechocystis sp. PCC 6714]
MLTLVLEMGKGEKLSKTSHILSRNSIPNGVSLQQKLFC